MPDDPNAALIERMLDTYEDAPLDMSDEEAMSRVLVIVREHEAQALAEARARISELRNALTMMLAARESDGVVIDAAILKARAELAKETPE